jgi:hypothetical protein
MCPFSAWRTYVSLFISLLHFSAVLSKRKVKISNDFFAYLTQSLPPCAFDLPQKNFSLQNMQKNKTTPKFFGVADHQSVFIPGFQVR